VAERELATVGKRSRFYAAALYLRGVIQAKSGRLRSAVRAFCAIVDTPDQDKFTFYVDDRYYRIKDLARLGLGRLAHEESRYNDAYYHYFQIPDDSARLPEALFEAAWSMYARGEDETARGLLEELARRFRAHPIAPEAALLRAHADLRSCAFDGAQRGFDGVVADFEPLRDEAEELLRDPRRAQPSSGACSRREAVAEIGQTTTAGATLEDRLLGFTRVDPRFVRLHEPSAACARRWAMPIGWPTSGVSSASGWAAAPATSRVCPAPTAAPRRARSWPRPRRWSVWPRTSWPAWSAPHVTRA